MDAIVWKPVPIPGFGSDYDVSNMGDVRSRKTGHYRKLKPKINKHTGYMYVHLYNKGGYVTRSIHRLVALAFIPNPHDLPEVNHINEVKTDNRVSNLEWVTTHDNNEHSKYKRYKPLELRTPDGELLATFESERALSDVLGISKSQVCQALKGRRHTCSGFVINYKEGS